MPRCLISFGANIGDPLATIQQASDLLREYLQCGNGDFCLSRFFHTPPVGGPTGQPPFVNAVVAIQTEHSPWEVWQAVRNVEHQLGRQRVKRWEARRIDLDILLYDDLRLWTPQLKIPHPRMCMRRFILEPAKDVAADWIDPVSSLSIEQLTDRLRRRAASLILFADPQIRPQHMLEEVARKAHADYRSSCQQSDGFFASDDPQARWVACQPIPQFTSPLGEKLALDTQPQLLVFLADANESTGALWEDIHHGLAQQLGLASDEPATWIDGARYLLATDDRQWAIHELVAALEAMDCPVEPFTPEV